MKKFIGLLILVVLISGCASLARPWLIEKARNNLMKLELGMSKQEVIDIMGTPYNREAYTTPDGQLDFLIYLIDHPDGSGAILDRITTPICFVDGKVTGWGRNFYEKQKQRYEIEIKQPGR